MSNRALSSVVRRGAISMRDMIVRGGGGHHSPPPPPFVRLPTAPTGKPIALNRDLVWSDSVAPELLLDFDSPHITSGAALRSLLGALAMVPLFIGFLSLVNPDGMRRAAKRGDHLPDLRWEFGEIEEPEGETEALP
jgi:hypothetical protein